MTSTFNPQRRATPLAVADLGRVRCHTRGLMKKSLTPQFILTILILVTPLHAQTQKKKSTVDEATIPQGAVHIVLKSIDDAKQIFIYSSLLGIPEVPQPRNGIYRMEVNEKGKVAAVTILKGISPHADTFVMKQLVAWYAKSGPVRIVDVPVVYSTTPKLLDPFTSRRTGLPPGHRMPPPP
jgi:hypothetical protein